MKVILLASTFVLFAVFSQGQVYRCYECYSDKSDCKDAQNLKIIDCEPGDPRTYYLCYASSEMVEGDIYTYRKCVEKTEENIELCRKRNGGKTTCYTCSSELCNKEIQAEEDFKKKRAEEEFRRKQAEEAWKRAEEERKKKQEEEEFKEFKKKEAELKSFKCYVCEGKCEQPEEKQCEGATFGATLYSCQATATRTNGGVTEKRHCVLRTTEIMESCFAQRDKDHDCYLCDTKLCNDHRPALKDDEPSTPEPSTPEPSTPEPSTPEGVEGVQQCYFCESGSCENPRIVSCDDTRPTNFLCKSAVALDRDDPYVQQCVPNNRDQVSQCERLNAQPDYRRCYTCNTNLCNREAARLDSDFPNTDEGEGGVVTECYTCFGHCLEPRKEKCDVRQYLCQEVRTKSDDGTTSYERMCAAKTNITIELCKQLNQEPGTSCHTCDTDLCNKENKQYNTAAMLLTTLISQFLTKLLSM